MTFGQIQVLCGFIGTGLVTLLTVIRQRKLSLEDVGAALAAFLSATPFGARLPALPNAHGSFFAALLCRSRLA